MKTSSIIRNAACNINNFVKKQSLIVSASVKTAAAAADNTS